MHVLTNDKTFLAVSRFRATTRERSVTIVSLAVSGSERGKEGRGPRCHFLHNLSHLLILGDAWQQKRCRGGGNEV
jgi:hypothetical protein